MSDTPKQTAPAPDKPQLAGTPGRYKIQNTVSIKNWNVPVAKVANYLYGQR